MAHAQPRVPALLDVILRTAEAENQKIAEPLSRAFQILGRIHGAEHVIVRDLTIKSLCEPLKAARSDCRINV